jgi:hypothetical protein
MVLNQHIRRKKRKEKFLDVMLLTTNRTTVPWPVQSVHFLCPQRHELRPQRSQEDLLYHFKKGMVCQF